jgi:hypothetical protein
VEGKLYTGLSKDNPVVINFLQPNNHGNQPTDQTKPPAFGSKSLSNALKFQGTAPTPAQMADKGSTCNYWGKSGHWASNCQKLGRDIQAGRLQMTPLGSNPTIPKKELSTTTKPIHVQTIAAPKSGNNTILVHSGASSCVSGNSPFFHVRIQANRADTCYPCFI